MWDWRCAKCSITGSCPVDAGTMVDDAVELVAKHHGMASRECNLEFGVDHIELMAVVSYRSKGEGVPPERVGVAGERGDR